MTHPLYVAFIWHMHQPYYKDTVTGRYGLPWVRLHAVKDYLHLANVIGDFPRVRQTINVVPSLAEQLGEYASGVAIDRDLEISLKAATSGVLLDDSDKRYVLKMFFSINWDRFIAPVGRFLQLGRLREIANGDIGLFADKFWLDLIAWYNLAWIDPSIRRSTPRLQALFDKGRDFTHDDIAVLIEAHRSLCAAVIPAYRRLWDTGNVELTTSPYFHPILPLLINTNSARESSMNLPLPRHRFAHSEDASRQLAQAIMFHEQTFGRPPRGLWPSEGALSQPVLDLVRDQTNLSWLATDEHVLERSLGIGFGRDEFGHLHDPRPMFQPYRSLDNGPAIFFRDQVLSDRIGFVYQHWGSDDAAADVMERLLQADRVLQSQRQSEALPPIVTIALDGENCWEFYPNNGDNFLRSLFARIGNSDRVQAVTPSEYLDLVSSSGTGLTCLPKVPAASWIAANLETWIGEPDQNRAWEYLALARDRLTAWNGSTGRNNPDQDRRAWHALDIAEGSDWFWWFYSHNRIGGEAAFDERFRSHLANVYRAIEAPVPDWLLRPIASQLPVRERPVSGPRDVSPLSNQPDASPAWATAGFVDADGSTGSMQFGASVFRRLFFGYDADALYFRLEFGTASRNGQLSIYVGPSIDARENRDGLNSTTDHVSAVVVPDDGFKPGVLNNRIDLFEDGRPPLLYRRDSVGGFSYHLSIGEFVFGHNAMELRVPRPELNLGSDDRVYVTAALRAETESIEAVPANGVACFALVDPIPVGDHVVGD